MVDYLSRYDVAHDMDSTSAGHPLQNALAALTTFDCLDFELHELLIHLVEGSAAASQNTEWVEEE